MAMRAKEGQILNDARGRKTHVVLPFRKHEEIFRCLEDADDVKAMRQVEHEKGISWKAAKNKLRKKA
jgi:hypothetical protein